MRIAIAGGSGFIGSKILEEFKGHEFTLLKRPELYGNPEVLAESLKGADVVMNFAGYPVSSRWTTNNRKRIMESRVVVTRNLVTAINSLDVKPKQFISASAIGLYAPGQSHDEGSTSFDPGFLGEVVLAWEAALEGLDASVQLLIPRIGVVMGNDGGAYPRLKTIFKWGIGGRLGSGKQAYSFIHIADVVRGIRYAMEHHITGPLNMTAPNPVSNREFTRALGKALRRPSIIPVPAFAMRIIMGKTATIVLEGAAVFPKRLQDEGYKFTFATIESTLANLVSNP